MRTCGLCSNYFLKKIWTGHEVRDAGIISMDTGFLDEHRAFSFF
jgi:hypothetical protein